MTDYSNHPVVVEAWEVREQEERRNHLSKEAQNLDDVLREWARQVNGLDLEQTQTEYSIRAINNMMYWGLKLLQMVQVLKDQTTENKDETT